MKVWDSAGDPPVESPPVLAITYNNGYILTNHTLGFLFYGLERDQISDYLSGANYSTTPSSYHSGNTIYALAPNYTVFMITTHAGDGFFGDYYNSGTGLVCDSTGLTAAMTGKGVLIPPYNFAMVDGCHSAGEGDADDDLANSFDNLASATDRAFMG